MRDDEEARKCEGAIVSGTTNPKEACCHIPKMNDTVRKTTASKKDLGSTSMSACSINEISAKCWILGVVAILLLLDEDERTTMASAPKERPIRSLFRLSQ